MRRAIEMDDELAERFREAAHARGQSLSEFFVQAGRMALRETAGGSEERFV